MITCPTCGHPVPENQRFCGNCGTDVQAANAYRATQNPQGSGSAQSGGTDYGFDQETYDYGPPPGRRPSTAVIALILAAVAALCLCCGLLIGGVAAYWLFPVQSIPAAPAPTPQDLNMVTSFICV